MTTTQQEIDKVPEEGTRASPTEWNFRCTCPCDCQTMLVGANPRLCHPCHRGRHYMARATSKPASS